ncbi:uncharacterized protein B0H64DRAFT_8418 [Chaetomium fimeti]|uniref:Uncharacterized protein n=1 Tax=Chaetomium fimeti TaxID=1854472 RepID=A0AAE0HPS4_9PEZI|nr:hypothetical protein B0H64DRAFT_8418 [Chaetomium fimeti]
MAHQALINTISARWEFSVGAWKRAQGLDRLPMLHELTAEHLNEYMQDKAAENLALATATTDLALFSTGLCPGCEQPGQEPDYVTERLEVMNAWDLREYMFALDDLKDNLVPALRCSLQCFAASFLTNAVHLYFWPLPQHKVVGFALTALTVYHAGFALTYRWFLCLIARCRSHTEQLKHKVDGVLRQRVAAGGYRGGDADDLCEDDVRAWCGWKFKVVSHVAWERDLRSSFYETGLTWRSFLEGSMSWLTL